MLDIQLDPRNEEELLNQAIRHAFEKSGGQLTNLNPSNPLVFLLEAQVFAGAELLYWVNQLPAKLILYFLQQFLTIDTTAKRSTGSLLINLTEPLASNYTISQLEVSAGQEVFRLISPVVITAGNTEATGLIEAVDLGERFNKPAFSLNTLITPIAYVRSVTNLNPTEGGQDELSPELAIQEYSKQYRDAQLISIQDYENAVKSLVGSSYTVKVVYQDGVRVLLGAEDVPLDLIRAVHQNLTSRSILTANLVVQALKYTPLEIFLEVRGDETQLDDFYQFLLDKFRKGLQFLTRDDLVRWVTEFGYFFISGYFDSGSDIAVDLGINGVYNLDSLYLRINGNPVIFGNGDRV